MPVLKVLRYFGFKIFYLSIDSNSDFKKNSIANKLKNNNIYPLPIEFEKEISSKSSHALCYGDSDRIAYKTNIKLNPEKNLRKYCDLFSINESETKKLRILFQDFISYKHCRISGKVGVWSNLYPSKKIIYVGLKFTDFYTTNTGNNIYKIVIPIDILNYFIKEIKNTFLSFLSFKFGKNKNRILNKQNSKELVKKNVAFVVHKGLLYNPSKEGLLYEKTLYYSEDQNSQFNKYNILHLDYSNFSANDQNISWVCLKKIKIPKIKIFFKTLTAVIKKFYLIRNWSTFLGWILCIQQYNTYLKYCERIKIFKSLKLAIIDFDTLCPKTLILAFHKNNIKTISTQARFVSAFSPHGTNVHILLHTYYTSSKYTANVIKKSEYFDVKNIITMGQYKSDSIQLYKKQAVPKEISSAKEHGKKIIIALGHHSTNNWFDSYSDPVLNWSAQKNFLNDMFLLSKKLDNTFIVLRYKSLDWLNNTDFSNILEKLNNAGNIIFSKNYKEPDYSYKLCSHADLVIAKQTSLGDECLSNGSPVLFYEYTHNMKGIFMDMPNYMPEKFKCYNFIDLLEKSKSILFQNSDKFKQKYR